MRNISQFIVSCPVLKGCHSYGKTIDMDNIREAIELCIEDENIQLDNKFIGFRGIEVANHEIACH